MQEQNSYQPSPALIVAREAIEAAQARCKKLASQVDETAALLPSLEADVQRTQTDLAAEEGALALCEKADVKRHEKAIERLSTELADKERDLRRARAKIEALEGMAPELDEQVAARASEAQVEKGIWIQEAIATLSVEIEQAVKPLQAVIAKARAMQSSFAQQELQDFVQAVWLPEPQGFMRLQSQHGLDNVGTNLLGQCDEVGQAAAHGVAEALSQLQRVLSGARAHSAYIPLAKRSKPYVRRGYVVQGRDYFSDKAKADVGEPVAASACRPQELNMGPAMVENIGRPTPQVQQ